MVIVAIWLYCCHVPRVANHDERRALIAGAFQRLLAAEGLGRTSFVRVAAEAGTSVGLIQHYFVNREELLRFAYEECLRSMDARVETQIREGEAAGKPISELLLAGLGELLPVDDERAIEHRVRQNLLTESLGDAALAGVARRAAADMHTRVATAVENGKECGEVRADVDGAVAGSMILATAHGLAGELALVAPRAPAPTADEVLRPVVSLVFTGRCRHYDR